VDSLRSTAQLTDNRQGRDGTDDVELRFKCLSAARYLYILTVELTLFPFTGYTCAVVCSVGNTPCGHCQFGLGLPGVKWMRSIYASEAYRLE
jgi:hypothetical protein